MDQHETDIAGRIKNGDEAAFREAYETFSRAVYVFVIHYLKDEELSKDMMQEAFASLWISRQTIIPEKGYRSLILKIARNNALNQLRKQSYSSSYMAQLESESEDFMHKVIENDYISKSVDIFSALPANYREVFILKRKRNMKNKEIAEYLGVSIKTVEYRMTQALRILREKLSILLKD